MKRRRQGNVESRVQLAGALSVDHEGASVHERALPGRQARLTFAYLVLEREGTISHTDLASALWPEGPPGSWQAAVRSIASRVRTFLDQVGIDGATALTGEAGRYDLALPDHTVVDIEQAMAEAQHAEDALASGRVDEARSCASRARAVLSQPFLPGVGSPWADSWRQRLGSSRARCLEVLGECRLRADEVVDALTVFEEAVRLDVLRESAWRGVMRAHAAAGNQAKALEAYERLRIALVDQLGTDPSPATRQLHVELLRSVDDRYHGERDQPDEDAAARRPATTPYRGLARFNEEDAALYFGRESDTRALIERLRERDFVAVVGPSGSGKSSLVRAGLLPALAAGAVADSDTWRRATFVPGTDPLEAMCLALAALGSGDEPPLRAATLRSDPEALDAAIRALLTDCPPSQRVLLVVDQFEEVFTQTRDPADRDAFIRALLAATQRHDSRTVVVITLRADFYAQAARQADLAEALNRSQHVVGPLDPDALERAIEGPAHHVGARLEPGLTARVLADVTGRAGALPLLQYALLELWVRRDGDGTLTLAAYDEIGGIQGAVVQRAEAVFDALDHTGQTLARRVLLRLIEPGESGPDTRRRVRLTELDGIGDRDDLTSVVDALVDARLVTAASVPGGQRTLEVTHEALIRAWPRLAQWVAEDRDGLRLHRRLTEAARDWDDAGRDEDLLWRGLRLAEARGWVGADPDRLNPIEVAFLDAATTAEERSARRRRLAMQGLVAVSLLGAFVLGILALAATQRGELARSRELALRSASALDTDTEASLILALEAYATADTPEAEAAIRTAHAANALDWRTTLEHHAGSVRTASDGSWVAAAGPGGVTFLDPHDGTPLASTDAANEVTWVDRAADGRSVITVLQNETLVLDEDMSELASLPLSIGAVFSPDDRYIVGTSINDGTFIADADTYEMLHHRPLPFEQFSPLGGGLAGGPRRGTFSRDGRVLLHQIGDDLATARVVDLATGRNDATFVVAAHEGDGAFAPDGSLLALEGDGALVVYETEGWAVTERWPLAEDLTDLVWLDGDRLVTMADSGATQIRRLGGGARSLVGLEQGRSVRLIGDVILGLGVDRVILWDPETGVRLREIVAGEATKNETWQIDNTATHLIVPAGNTVVAYALDAGGSIVRGLDADRLRRGPYYGLLADGRIAAVTGDTPGRLQLLDPATMEVTDSVPAAYIDGFAVDDTGTRMAVTAPDDELDVVIYDLSLEQVARWTAIDPSTHCPPDECHISGLAFGPDGSVGVGTRGGYVRVFEPNGTLVAEVPPPTERHTGSRVRLVFGVNGEVITHFKQAYRPIRRVSLDGGDAVFLPGHEDEVWHSGRHPETGTLALADLSGRVTIWEPGASAPAQVLETGAGVTHLHFAGTDRLLVSSVERAVLWDLSSGRPIASFAGNATELRGALWLGDDQVVTLGVGGDVRTHRCHTCAPIQDVIAAARASLTRDLTDVERARYLGD